MTTQTIPLSSTEKATTVLPNLERIIRGLLYVYVFSLPFPQLLFIERNGFLLLLALLTIWCAISRQHFFLQTALDRPLLVLVGWVAVSVPFATSPAYSAGELGKLAQQALIFYVAAHFLRDAHDRARALWLVLGGLTAVSVYGIWQFAAKLMGINFYPLIESFFSHETWLTTYLVTVVPLSAAMAMTAPVGWQRTGGWVLTGLGMTCQLLTFSRAGLLALFVEAIVLAVLVRKRVVTALAVALIISILVVVSTLVVLESRQRLFFIPGPAKLTTYNLESRMKVWRLGASKLMEHPLLGIGYGKSNFYSVTKEDPRYLEADNQVPMAVGLHNTFLDVSVGAGLPAGLAYLWLMWAGVRAGVRQFHSETDVSSRMWSLALAMLVAGVFARNLFDHMWIGSMALLFWVLVAVSLQPAGESGKAAAS